MSDMHILAGGSVVMHIAVPATNNLVSVPYRTALLESGSGGSTSLSDAVVDGSPQGWEITVAEKALIESGAVLERSTTFDFGELPGTLAQKRDALLAIVADRGIAILLRLQNRLEYFGYAGSTP